MDSSRETNANNLSQQYSLVKSLFLRRKYRQCVQTCLMLLDATSDREDPLHQLYIRFYLASAYDELARAMHHYSLAKIPAFGQAERAYTAAIELLPSSGWQHKSASKTPPQGLNHDELSNDNEEGDSDTELLAPPPDVLKFELSPRPRDTSSPAVPSRPTSPYTRVRSSIDIIRSPSVSPSPTTSSFYSDLESHDSYRHIMTPSRIPKLERDYSSLSLLDDPCPHPARRSKSLNHSSLLKMENPHATLRSRSPPSRAPSMKLPRLSTNPPAWSPVRKQLRSPSEQVSPLATSPVSPLEEIEVEQMSSEDELTISPISPITPAVGEQHARPRGQDDEALMATQPIPSESPSHDTIAWSENLSKLRFQLYNHLSRLRDAKEETLRVQAERAATFSHQAELPFAPGQRKEDYLVSAAGDMKTSLAQSRSYWLFVPNEVQATEKSRRIEIGRERRWERGRFDPRRYMDLAEVALAEL